MKRLFNLLLAVFLLLPYASAWAQTYTPGPKKNSRDSLVIVVIGSSTAAGTGVKKRDSSWVQRYAAYLSKNRIPATVINLAKNGYCSYHLQPDGFVSPAGRPQCDTVRNISKALRYSPDAIIMNLPSNDASGRFPIEEQQQNIERIIAQADSQSVPVWITTTQPRNFDPDQRVLLAAMRDWIESRYQQRSLDFWSGLASIDGSILPSVDAGDGIHLNDAAHRLLFERVVLKDIPGILKSVYAKANGAAPSAMSSVLVYPNPFTATTSVAVTLDNGSLTTITISDILGKTKTISYSGFLTRGQHILPLDLSKMSHGVYIYQINAGGATRFGKLVNLPG